MHIKVMWRLVSLDCHCLWETLVKPKTGLPIIPNMQLDRAVFQPGCVRSQGQKKHHLMEHNVQGKHDSKFDESMNALNFG